MELVGICLTLAQPSVLFVDLCPIVIGTLSYSYWHLILWIVALSPINPSTITLPITNNNTVRKEDRHWCELEITTYWSGVTEKKGNHFLYTDTMNFSVALSTCLHLPVFFFQVLQEFATRTEKLSHKDLLDAWFFVWRKQPRSLTSDVFVGGKVVGFQGPCYQRCDIFGLNFVVPL